MRSGFRTKRRAAVSGRPRRRQLRQASRPDSGMSRPDPGMVVLCVFCQCVYWRVVLDLVGWYCQYELVVGPGCVAYPGELVSVTMLVLV